MQCATLPMHALVVAILSTRAKVWIVVPMIANAVPRRWGLTIYVKAWRFTAKLWAIWRNRTQSPTSALEEETSSSGVRCVHAGWAFVFSL
ncbi:hypothetical protein EJ02DRAFT_184601 [Clathrospora elynae]|uniref:Secreted protein n=1 Tax=Clathrospora elynae TaxID=706981 RepID=A0A6A5SPU9_9PLEO|nr:hypothetical protein EJ02DRAFT_184601 [Clathrospora elynae]